MAQLTTLYQSAPISLGRHASRVRKKQVKIRPSITNLNKVDWITGCSRIARRGLKSGDEASFTRGLGWLKQRFVTSFLGASALLYAAFIKELGLHSYEMGTTQDNNEAVSARPIWTYLTSYNHRHETQGLQPMAFPHSSTLCQANLRAGFASHASGSRHSKSLGEQGGALGGVLAEKLGLGMITLLVSRPAENTLAAPTNPLGPPWQKSFVTTCCDTRPSMVQY